MAHVLLYYVVGRHSRRTTTTQEPNMSTSQTLEILWQLADDE